MNQFFHNNVHLLTMHHKYYAVITIDFPLPQQLKSPVILIIADENHRRVNKRYN